MYYTIAKNFKHKPNLFDYAWCTIGMIHDAVDDFQQ